ncbi:Gfo/Idh/MocA family protein [Leuconostoc pseudomesenteroides]|uniref:Gfo/Idh/MocA family protein n=1 Tax=Leuconostoc pseudomesenteroides TaxID=33968 RepID=UPI002286288A|nr:Gfo/Idh/MocA family oxidoreductase [Leuconostoc pseudomesenteroides]WAM37648.1 Gfo/Idh/MocA family oxidoreductase [Leuconostoc pseudomesenteroides]
MEIKPINAAIIGCGTISDTYLENLITKFKIINVVSCYDRNVKKMEEKSKKFNIVASDLDSIMNDKNIKIIVILTNPNSHFELAKMALLKGKHVYTEKTIATTLQEGEELLDISKRGHLYLGSAPDTFLGSGVQTANYMLEHKLIGHPQSAVVSLNRDFSIFGDILPHLNQKGGTMPFDTGSYYLTALCSMFGPVKSIFSFGNLYQKRRTGKRIDTSWFGQKTEVADYNIMTSVLKFNNDILATIHLNSESIVNEKPILNIYGSEGIIAMGDPNHFGSKNVLYKPGIEGDGIVFPETHGFSGEYRGLGVAEMAWAISGKRKHRATGEMATHILEIVEGMYKSAHQGQLYSMSTTCDRPSLLPSGYIEDGFWSPTAETALI